jgi:hypothetical protein
MNGRVCESAHSPALFFWKREGKKKVVRRKSEEKRTIKKENLTYREKREKESKLARHLHSYNKLELKFKEVYLCIR